MRLKSLIALAITTMLPATFVATSAVPAQAAFVRVCVTNDHVEFNAPLTLNPVPAAGTVTASYNAGLPATTCRTANIPGGTVTDPGTPPSPLGGTYSGNCLVAVLGGPYFQGVLVAGSVWVTVDQGAGFIAAVSAKVLVPDVICSESEANGVGASVIVG